MTGPMLDRVVQFRRYTETDDGFSTVKEWEDHGPVTRAAKKDVSDSERWRASEVYASLTTRFVVRWSPFTRDLNPKDRLVCDGMTYEITGIKEGQGRRMWLELSCTSEVG